MAKTGYRAAWWLIQAMDGKFGRGEYIDDRGYSLTKLYSLKYNKHLDFLDEISKEREKNKFRQDLMRWRSNIYNDFGLAILMQSFSNDNKGNGGYFYYLHNPEALDENSKNLRKFIEYLAENEGKSDEKISLTKMNKLYATSSLGCLSAIGTTSRELLGEDNLVVVQFAMQFGEVIPIRYGKVSPGIDINAPCCFEPYQVKEIEGRWYAIGNLYPKGHKENASIVVYDLSRIRLFYNDDMQESYEPVENFDVNDGFFSMSDYLHVKKIQRVVSVELEVSDEALAREIRHKPLGSAQEEINIGRFKIYVRPTLDFLTQLCAFGDEVKIDWTDKNDEDIVLLNDILNRVKSAMKSDIIEGQEYGDTLEWCHQEK